MKTTILGQQNDEPTTLETVKMSIDQNSIDTLMSNLTNLYSDPVKAVVREYSANGIDSHLRAGQSLPVQITMPTDRNSFFVVQDFGTGMSKEEIANVYSRYGLSTKSGSNDEIGGFGLGCKSALAIADRFDIVSVKDGVKVEAFIKKNKSGVGVVHFVSETPTSETSGVKVSIPVDANKISSFQNNISMFDTWAEGSVVVDGQPNKAIQYKDNWLAIAPAGESIAWVEMNERVGFAPSRYVSQSSIVSNITYTIGGIRYDFERNGSYSIIEKFGRADIVQFMSSLASDNKVIINLPIGSVDLTPSREALMLTDKTVNAIKASFSDVVENLRSTSHAYLQGLTLEEAVKVFANNHFLFADEIDYSSYGYRANLLSQRPEFYGVEHHGEQIPTWVEVGESSFFSLVSQDGTALGDGEFVARIYTLNAHNGFGGYGNNQAAPSNIVVSVDGVLTEATVSAFRKNLRDYAKATGDSTNISALLTNDAEISKWVTMGYALVTFDSYMETARKYRSMKKSMAQTGTKRSSTSYPVLDLTDLDGSIIKVSIDDFTGDGSDVVLISADSDNISVFDGMSVWGIVNDVARGSRGRVSTESNFHRAFGKVFAGKKIVFIGKGKKAQTFLNKFPKAVSYNDGVAESVKSVIADKKANVFAGLVSINSNNSRGNSAFEVIGHELASKNMMGNLTDVYTRDVFTAIGFADKMFYLAQMFDNNKTVKEAFPAITSEAFNHSLSEKFSIFRRMGFYSRHDNLDENELKQIVMLINAVTA